MREEIEKMRRLCETDETVREAVSKASSYDEVIAIAAGHGIALQESDFMAKPGEGDEPRELDEDEMATIAGGGCGEVIAVVACLATVGVLWFV